MSKSVPDTGAHVQRATWVCFGSMKTWRKAVTAPQRLFTLSEVWLYFSFYKTAEGNLIKEKRFIAIARSSF